MVCETVSDFSAKITRLVEDASRRTEVGARGKAYVAARYSWDVLTQRLGTIVDDLARSAATPTLLAGISRSGGEEAERHPGRSLNGDAR